MNYTKNKSLEGPSLNHSTTINGIKFTSRELDILAFIVSGRRVKTIARLLSIASKTVETHIQNIMRKLESNSQESIIDFIEKSGSLAVIKQRYLTILISDIFKQILNEIAHFLHNKPITDIAIYSEEDRSSIFSNQIEKHLKGVGIRVTHHLKKADQLLEDIKISGTDKKILCIVSNKTLRQSQNFNNGYDVQTSPSSNNAELKSNNIIFLLSEKFTDDKDYNTIVYNEYVDFRDHKAYYSSFFILLQKLYPTVNFDPLITTFEHQKNGVQDSSDASIIQTRTEKNTPSKKLVPLTIKILEIISNRYKVLRAAIICFSILVGIALTFIDNKPSKVAQENKSPKQQVIRSDLLLPTEPNLLQRPQLIEEIQEKLKGDHGIQAVALVGTGGAGKTTLARQYASKQKANIIWEINAETHENLKSSFENLAQALAKTETDKKITRDLLAIKNQVEKEEKIIQFVKERLKSHSNWILIYDNVEMISEIQKQFPQDPETWGTGKIILTTRDINIQNNKNLNNVIQVGELTFDQKLNLFTKIISQGNINPIAPLQNEEIKIFLKGIPSFPLDVSLAAYYLKAINIPYSEYLEKLTQNNKDFVIVQENLLKETGDYVKTRYGIITLSLQHIINSHKDFSDLLLFISLLDSQNIPKNLLDKHKKSEAVDNLIFYLKKYSLITNESPYSLHTLATFSIHRSTQEIVLAYFRKVLNIEKKQALIQDIGLALENYIEDVIHEQNLLKMHLLANHCEVFLRHNDLLPHETVWTIKGELGGLRFYLANYQQAIKLMEQSLTQLNKSYIKNPMRIARISMYLGITYRELGNYINARNLLEESLVIYKNHFSNDDVRMARLLGYLGNVHRYLGDFLKAKVLLEESLLIHKKKFSENDIEIAENLTFLGNIYRDLGNYEKSRELLEESLKIHKKHFSKDDAKFPGVLIYLGETHRELGNYMRARDLLEESLLIHKKHFSNNYDKEAWSLTYLGNVYRELGSYEKAKNILEEALIIHKKHFSKHHVGAARTLACLGNVYRDLGYYEKARDMLEDSLCVHKKHFSGTHARVAQVLVLLGSVHKELGNYTKARALLEEAFLIYKKTFPEDHIVLSGIQVHLSSVYNNLKNHEKDKKFLETSQITYEKTYGKDHIETGRVLRSIGQIYLFQNDIKTAENLFNKALAIFQKNNHPDSYTALECLAELYLKKSIQLSHDGYNQQSQVFKNQAIDFLKRALGIVKTHFPEDSPHIMRIKSKL